MTLHLRLIGTMSGVLLLVLGVGGVFGYRQTYRGVDAEIASGASLAAAVIRRTVGELGRSAEPYRDLAALVRDFDGNVYVAVDLLDAGRVVASSRPPVVDDPAPAWFAAAYRPDRPALIVPVDTLAGREAAFRIRPTGDREVTETWREARLAVAVLGAFFAVALVGVSLLIARSLRPLTDLAEAFRRIGDGDYAVRVGPRGPAEMVALIRHINAMAERLEMADARNRRLAAQIATIQEEERAELARDLHDEVGPFLFAIDVDAATLARAAKAGPLPETLVTERVAGIREAAAQARLRVRAILEHLREGVVDRLGLASGIDDLVAFWRDRAPQVTFAVAVDRETFGAHDAVAMRIIREAVANALRHALPTRIEIMAERRDDGMIAIVVADDGGGLRDDRQAAGYGLIGMRERVETIGGTLVVEDRADAAGVRILARLPAGGREDER